MYTINAAYTLDKLLIAGEYTSSEEDSTDDLSAYMILADYDVNEKLGVAVRYSNWETAANVKLINSPSHLIILSLKALVLLLSSPLKKLLLVQKQTLLQLSLPTLSKFYT